MSDTWLRRIAWGTSSLAIGVLIVSMAMLFLAPDHSSVNLLTIMVSSFVTLGAPILGAIIVTKQPRNRVGWLWIVYGLLIGLRSLGHGIYYYGGSQPSGYSALEYFLLWLTEPANLTVLACLILMILWFPNGQLPSRRWRFLYIWLFLALAVLYSSLFVPGPAWNGGANSGGIVIDNPYGWLPENAVLYYLGFPSFISLLLILFLAAISLISRYRSAGHQVRLQLRWFVVGGFFFIILLLLPVSVELSPDRFNYGIEYLLVLLGQAYVIPLYMAVGIAILRYRLYDIDVIIRKTLVYGLLSGLLALIYFGLVVLLQSVFDSVSGQQSPVAIVISTLVIAALFAPLRQRVQAVIDRRFFRKKYDAQQVLAQFAQTARDETDMDALQAELLCVVQATMQPEQASIWLKPAPPAVRTSFRSGHE
ncbi:MAG: hypothetical protein KA362_06725 [Chloroflexi bacterium]|nr:hypothetical protein [Chloroflexota bacterium]